MELPSTRPWRSSRSPRPGESSTCLSGRPGRESPPRWPRCEPPGKPSTARGRCSGSHRRPPRAEVLASELGIDTENVAKWLYEHRQEAERLANIRGLRSHFRSLPEFARARRPLRQRIIAAETEVTRWRLRPGQLVIVDEASLAGTFALDELGRAAATAGAKIVLVGDHGQLSSVEAGGMFAALVRDREGFAPELTDVHRFHHAWEKRASVELRAGSPDVIDTYQDHERIADGDREQMLDALYAAWRKDTTDGRTSLMIAGDLGTVSELNARARADRVAEGAVADVGVEVAGGGTAGVGDLVVTRQNDRRLCTGQGWVRNGDRWTVTATDQDGTMTVQRANGGGTVVLPATYVAEHVELAYASSAHRAQGRTVDTAHAFVTSTTTREALYVLATRGRESNQLYVDTHYDPDPQTAHDQATEAVSAKEVLAGVLRNEGADVAAHDMIRREQSEAEGMERLSAEYLTLAAMAQSERWDSLLVRSGLTDGDLAAVRASAAHGPLLAAFREAEARGLDVEDAFPRLVAGRSLADAADVAAVLHGRVERWTQAAGGRNRRADNLIAGLIPRAQGVSDPEMAQALAERDQAMEERARTLAEQAVGTVDSWATATWRPAGRLGPTGAMDARSVDHRRLPGPLAHHRQERSRQAWRCEQHGAGGRTPAGAGRSGAGDGYQQCWCRAADQSKPRGRGRGAERSRTVSKRKEAKALARWEDEARQWATANSARARPRPVLRPANRHPAVWSRSRARSRREGMGRATGQVQPRLGAASQGGRARAAGDPALAGYLCSMRWTTCR